MHFISLLQVLYQCVRTTLKNPELGILPAYLLTQSSLDCRGPPKLRLRVSHLDRRRSTTILGNQLLFWVRRWDRGDL